MFQGQITVFKDYNLFNKLAFFNPLWSPYWSESFMIITSSAIVDHIIFILLSATQINKMTGYDL